MKQRPLYLNLASLIGAVQYCAKNKNEEWETKHRESIREIMDTAPSGSGIDCGTEFDMVRSGPNKLVFHFSYHHMDENGMYDGWTDHTLTVTASLVSGIDLKISGPNKNELKEYLYDVYYFWLMETEDDNAFSKADIDERKVVLESLTNLRMEQESLADNMCPRKIMNPEDLTGDELEIYQTLRRSHDALDCAISYVREAWGL